MVFTVSLERETRLGCSGAVEPASWGKESMISRNLGVLGILVTVGTYSLGIRKWCNLENYAHEARDQLKASSAQFPL